MSDSHRPTSEDFLAKYAGVFRQEAFVDYNDTLQVQTAAPFTAEVIFNGLIFTEEGKVVPFVEDVTGQSGARTFTTVKTKVGRGFIISCAAGVAGPTDSQRGSIYQIISIVRGPSQRMVLSQGYVQTGVFVTWPPGRYEDMGDGLGRVYNPAPASPGAGAEISITVPAAAKWRIIGLDFTLVASTTVATRTPSLIVDDGSSALHKVAGAQFATVAASGSQEYAIGQAGFGLGFAAVGNIENYLSMWLKGSSRIRTSTTNIQTGDQYTINGMLVEELLMVA